MAAGGLAAPTPGGRFVGREGELDSLRTAQRRSVAGVTQTALVLGEPGIGKTTLLAMFGTTVRADGATVLRVSGDED